MSLVIPCDSRGNPVELSTLENPARWLLDVWGAGPSSSGVAVSRETAMACSAFWKGAMLVAGAVAKCKAHVYSVNGDIRTINRKHPAYSLVRYAPNPYQTAFEFNMQMQLDLGIDGNAYAMIDWNGRGLPTQLLPIPAENVRLITTPNGPIYEVYLYFEDVGSRTYHLDRSEMMHLKWMPKDGWQGTSMIGAARNILGQLIAMQRYSGSFFKNSGRPDIVIKHPMKFADPNARRAFREDWRNVYSGSDNAYKAAILDEGMDIQVLSQKQNDSQFIETWRQCCIEVANFWGLPPSKVGMIEASAYKSLEQDELAAKTDCYMPHIINWTETYNATLLSTAEQKSGSAEFGFDTSPLDVSDITSRGTFFSKALGNNRGWMTPNEVRATQHLNPIDGGDELQDPTNTSAHQEPSNSTNQAIDPATEEALSALVADSVRRAVARASKEVLRGHKASGLAGAHDALARDMEVNSEIVRASIRAAALVARKDADAAAEEVSSRLHASFCVAISGTHRTQPESFHSNFNAAHPGIAEEIINYATDYLFRRAA